jgi:hypothetical protein
MRLTVYFPCYGFGKGLYQGLDYCDAHLALLTSNVEGQVPLGVFRFHCIRIALDQLIYNLYNDMKTWLHIIFYEEKLRIEEKYQNINIFFSNGIVKGEVAITVANPNKHWLGHYVNSEKLNGCTVTGKKKNLVLFVCFGKIRN